MATLLLEGTREKMGKGVGGGESRWVSTSEEPSVKN